MNKGHTNTETLVCSMHLDSHVLFMTDVHNLLCLLDKSVLSGLHKLLKANMLMLHPSIQ